MGRTIRLRLALPLAWSVAAVLCLPACSAILGIDDIPPAGEFPIDAGGKTCMELLKAPQSEINMVCANSAAAKGVPPSECFIECNSAQGTTADCVCGTDGGGFDGDFDGTNGSDTNEVSDHMMMPESNTSDTSCTNCTPNDSGGMESGPDGVGSGDSGGFEGGPGEAAVD